MFDTKRIFLAISLVLASGFAFSQWQPCKGIAGADVRDVIMHDSILFIASPGNGIFMRNFTDTVWEPSFQPYGAREIKSTGSALFGFGTMYRPVRSLDNGNTWQIFGDYMDVIGMDVCDTCVFLLDYHTLKRSCDDGESWTPIYPSAASQVTEGLFAQQDILFCTLADIDSVFQSSDMGETWTELPNTGISGSINDIYLREGSLWLGTGTGVFNFNEQLNEWMPVSDSIPVGTEINSIFEDENGLACCTTSGYFRFDEEDSIWIAVNSGLESKTLYAACNTGSSVVVATGSGPFVRQFGSLSWISDYSTLYQRDVNQVFKAGARTYALSSGRIYYSDDLSDGFHVLETQGFCSSGKIVITDTAWYAASGCGFLVSADSGLTWTAHTAGMEGISVQDVAIADSFYYARVYGGLFRTRNDTINWERTPNSIGTANVWGVNTVNNVVFARVYGATGLYRSTDNGTTFSPVPEAGSYAPDLFVRDSLIFVLKGGFGLIYSTDAGESWNTWVSGLTNTMLTCMDLSSMTDTTLLGGGDLNPGALVAYILKFYTPGNPYGEDIREGLPLSTYPYIRAVFLDNGRIFAAPSKNGLWYRDDFIVGISDDEFDPGKPGYSQAQMQVFPNPASGQITLAIKDGIRNGIITILDSEGRSVMNIPISGKGKSISVNVTSLSEGTYMVILTKGATILETGKFVKVRY